MRLPDEMESGDPRIHKPIHILRHRLPSGAPRADDAAQIIMHLSYGYRSITILGAPSDQELDCLTPVGIVALDLLDPVDGVDAAQRQQGVTNPSRPDLKAA
jgi:hypothetical protein